MRLLRALAGAVLPFLAVASSTGSGSTSDAAQSETSSSSTTVYYWPLDAASPSVLAKVSYDPKTLGYQIDEYNSPVLALSSSSSSENTPGEQKQQEQLVRIGLYDPATHAWTGTVTQLASFAEEYHKSLALSVDARGEVWHVGFRAWKQGPGTGAGTGTGNAQNSQGNGQKGGQGKNQGNGQKQQGQGEESKGGENKGEIKVELVKPNKGAEPHLNKPIVLNPDGKMPQKEPEKTILQKYWWVFAAITLLLMAGGGDK
ncbi:hypothetical protein L228DRAFT_260855 [Xylona heveae TC161]|uniref:Uncharacterized protein n=1 Tax=Xylona heveae (strain CBS 132557 / TC161) TaxID=1328760 RepID=A0A165GX28_XYLHT|nr:hypothetical protein L228DRAFT_260855 [Xylona heveae TC161]KZF22710.1 hypothetical protein L228DRAFT_260855 [Xylona heveae TC161]